MFQEYKDAEIVSYMFGVAYDDTYISISISSCPSHPIPSEDTPAEVSDTVNANVFQDLDTSVSEGGDKFSSALTFHKSESGFSFSLVHRASLSQ